MHRTLRKYIFHPSAADYSVDMYIQNEDSSLNAALGLNSEPFSYWKPLMGTCTLANDVGILSGSALFDKKQHVPNYNLTWKF